MVDTYDQMTVDARQVCHSPQADEGAPIFGPPASITCAKEAALLERVRDELGARELRVAQVAIRHLRRDQNNRGIRLAR